MRVARSTALDSLSELAKLAGCLDEVRLKLHDNGVFVTSAKFRELNYAIFPTTMKSNAWKLMNDLRKIGANSRTWIIGPGFSSGEVNRCSIRIHQYVGFRFRKGQFAPQPSPRLSWQIVAGDFLGLAGDASHPLFNGEFGQRLQHRSRLHAIAPRQFRHYLGFLGDQPVSSVTVFLTGRVGALYDLGVARAFRNNGFGTESTAFGIHEAITLGAHEVVVQTAKMTEEFFIRNGFQKTEDISAFHLSPFC